ncbi:hypothetical protein MED297_19277 [Reinekea sp. MED297]|uniref:Uncharacterized protein n=1 Tax=Reinekea blandensis MED297 TaxID=314283 RepID=A4B8W0_9GAMM|nr:hypothetical protein MED297_19277 [Reinekea sp. MED297] [Reinekea blandensis MED297]
MLGLPYIKQMIFGHLRNIDPLVFEEVLVAVKMAGLQSTGKTRDLLVLASLEHIFPDFL